jgi:hypothetical protein
MSNSGYLHPLYSQSLSEFGEPMQLPLSKGWILKRAILGTPEFDGVGCYPVFACEDWSSLDKDFLCLGDQLIALSLVTDPFGGYNQQDLIKCFVDIASPYKDHFIVDLHRRPEEFVTEHHRRNVQKALVIVNVEICTEPIKYLNEWVSLYDNLIERHNITGIAKFSRDSFSKQLTVPGIVAFRAVVEDKTVGMLLWYVQGDVGYYHLGAYSSDGYRFNASFALFWTLMGYFADTGIRWLSLGAGAGTEKNIDDGLTRFKRGWSTGVRPVYFCGRIFNKEKYRKIVEFKGVPPTTFFPAYRVGEY